MVAMFYNGQYNLKGHPRTIFAERNKGPADIGLIKSKYKLYCCTCTFSQKSMEACAFERVDEERVLSEPGKYVEVGPGCFCFSVLYLKDSLLSVV